MKKDSMRLETRLRSVFGFSRLPFTKELESHRIMKTPGFTEALDKLRYLVDRRGTGVVFGAPGTGKSTLLRALLDRRSHRPREIPRMDPSAAHRNRPRPLGGSVFRSPNGDEDGALVAVLSNYAC